MIALVRFVTNRVSSCAVNDREGMSPAELADAKRKLRAMGISLAGMTQTQRSEALGWASSLPDREVNSVPREVRTHVLLSGDGDIEKLAAFVEYGPEERCNPDGFRYREHVRGAGVADAA